MSTFNGILVKAMLLAYGVPLLGLAGSVLFWRRAGSQGNADVRRYQRFSFAAIAYVFFFPLVFDSVALWTLAARVHAEMLSVLFRAWPYFFWTGVLTSLICSALLLWKCEGNMRILGPSLALLSLLFSCVNVIFLLAGAGGI